jgi:phosphoribosylaminoimidazolecarboxamide formyltransferase / IMP cyclohydrolase
MITDKSTGRSLHPEPNDRQKYALVSVFDKTGVIELAKVIDRAGYRIIASGGTGQVLSAAGIEVTRVEKITGNPEAFDGRMKTISFEIEAGILYDRANPEHVSQAVELDIPQIDLVVCNLYPFSETTGKPNVSLEEAVEQIDVGGPTMVRAAAKNFKYVLIVANTKDYPSVARKLTEGLMDEDYRRKMASKAFSILSDYDSSISNFLAKNPK